MRLTVLAWLPVAALLAGCGPSVPVKLLIADENRCFVSKAVGLLVADPQYGTAIVDEYGQGGHPPERSVPIAWPSGFTGRQAGSEVEVVSPDGRVVATTGRRYSIPGGYANIYVNPGDRHPFWAALSGCGEVVTEQ